MMRVLYPGISEQNHSELMKLCGYYNATYQGDNKLWISQRHKPVVSIANKLWIEKDFRVLKTFQQALNVDSVGFFDRTKSKMAADTVNRWCCESTRGKIKKLVDTKDMSVAKVLITNAIYFAGKFKLSFNKDSTKENEPFFDQRRRFEVGKVSMMCSTKEKRTIALRVDEIWDVLKLEYADSSLSLLLVINKHGQGGEPELSTETLLDQNRCHFSERKCNIRVPKFRFEKQLRLKVALQAMGMTDAFDEIHADFSRIDGVGKLCIGSVIHKAMIKVDEEGTVAAAATAVVFTTRCAFQKPPVPQIWFDQPFSFHIIDEDKKVALFSGRFEGK